MEEVVGEAIGTLALLRLKKTVAQDLMDLAEVHDSRFPRALLVAAICAARLSDPESAFRLSVRAGDRLREYDQTFDKAASVMIESAMACHRERNAVDVCSRWDDKLNDGDEKLTYLLRYAGLLRAAGSLDAAAQLITSRILPVSSMKSRTYIASLHELSIIRDSQGLPREALAWIGKAFDAGREMTTTSDEAVILNSMGVYLLKLGEVDRAGQVLDRAIRSYEKARDTSGLSSTFLNRGNVCSASGQHRIAITYYHNALMLIARTGERASEITLLSNIAQCYLDLGQVYLYVKYLMWALDTSEELEDLKTRQLGLVSLARFSEPLEARKLYTEALGISTHRGDTEGKVVALIGIGDVLERLDKYEDALEFFLDAEKAAGRIDDPRMSSMIMFRLGATHARLNASEEAWASFESGWRTADEYRRMSVAEEVQMNLASDVMHHNEKAIKLAFQKTRESVGGTRDKWAGRFVMAVDRGRSRVLLDAIGAEASLVSAISSGSVRDGLAAMSNEVRRLRSLLARERQEGRDSEGVRHQLSRAYQDFAALNGYAEQADASFRRLRLADPVGLAELRGALRDNVVAIEYAIVGDSLASVVLTNSEISVTDHGDWNIIRIAAKDFVESCSTSSSEQSVLQIAQAMYDRLISPIEVGNSLRNAAAVVVVGPNELGAVPFEALYCGGTFLFERFPISYLPSLSINLSMNALAPLRRGLVLGDPDGTLLHARREAREVGALIPSLVGGRPLIGNDASLETLMRFAAASDVVHIASHADFSPEAAAFSTVVLASGEGGGNANLEVRDVLKLRLAGTLVVLSGCTTGAATANASNEYVGFVRGFLGAGAGGVVASRWAVQDSSTLEFMRHFYHALVGEGVSPIVALQNARRDQIVLGGYRHPRHWAAFGLFGRPDI